MNLTVWGPSTPSVIYLTIFGPSTSSVMCLVVWDNIKMMLEGIRWETRSQIRTVEVSVGNETGARIDTRVERSELN